MKIKQLRILNFLIFLLAAAAVALLSCPLHAQLITLDNTPTQSTVRASGQITDVNSLSPPYTTPTTYTAPGTSNTSATTPDLTTSALNFTFSQSIPEPNDVLNGEGDIYFIAGSNVTYAISGSETFTGTGSQGEIYAELQDVTAESTLYHYDNNAAGPTTATLIMGGGGAAGSLTGSLTAGDTYEFDAYEALGTTDSDQPASLDANIDINFSSVPEPSTWAMLLGGLGLLAFWRTRTSRAQA